MLFWFCKGPEGSNGPNCPCLVPHLPMAQHPTPAPGAVRPCPSNATAGLVCRSPQPCPGQPWAHVLAQPQPGWLTQTPEPRHLSQSDAQCLGLGLPQFPWVPCSWLRKWDGSWLPGPALMDPPWGGPADCRKLLASVAPWQFPAGPSFASHSFSCLNCLSTTNYFLSL